jgi:glycosyltransferase involved in cell wall biosynthesis
VDDGSVDETRSVVEQFSVLGFEFSGNDDENGNNNFPIRYFYQENGGKHRAINRGVCEAKGELFFIADSDDWMPDNALEIVSEKYERIKNDENIAGVCGLDAYENGEITGSGFPFEEKVTSTIEIRNRYGVVGDLKEVFKTEVLKEFSFPEIVGECFCPEVLVWNRIAQEYSLLFFNKVIYFAEYQRDGITSNIVKARMNSPIASMMCYQEMSELDIPLMQKIKAAINYWRFRFCSKSKDIPRLRWHWNWVMPIGYLLHRKDKKRER